MAYKKTKQELDILREGGEIIGQILDELGSLVVPGATAYDIDQRAVELIQKAGGRPSFKGYTARPKDPPFPGAICASLNQELVHGIPSKDKVIKDGDIFSIDVGMEYPAKNGLYTDTAITVMVGDVPEEIKKLVSVTRTALEKAIAVCQVGNTIADIGRTVEQYVESQGKYGIVKTLSGHGVGHAVHEDPWVPNFYVKDLENWHLEPGVVIAIEPMITLGADDVETGDDGWTIVPTDNSMNAHAEHTILVTEDGPVVATRRPSEK